MIHSKKKFPCCKRVNRLLDAITGTNTLAFPSPISGDGAVASLLKSPRTYYILVTAWIFILPVANINAYIVARHVNFNLMPLMAGAIFALVIAYYNNRFENLKKSESLFLIQVIESLAVALDERDSYTHGHARRVTCIAMILYEKLNNKQECPELLRLSSILHDIGKVGIPDAVLLKTGKLSDEDYALIKKHPEQGANILRPIGTSGKIGEVIKIIKHHHERYDGKGYPDGLAGENIPLFSRIIAIADSFDAMTSNRPYRKTMPLSYALSEIEKGKGKQFDPQLSDLFLSLYEDLPNSHCPNMEICPIFGLIGESETLNAYQSQYCSFFYTSCARYKTSSPDTTNNKLLPDGSIYSLC